MVEEKNITQKYKMKTFSIVKFIVIIILGEMATYGISSISQNSYGNQGTQNPLDNFGYNHAHHITNKMAEILLKRISEDENYRVNSRATEDVLGGKANYTVKDSFFENDSLIEIKATAKFNDVTTIVTTVLDRETRQKKSVNISFMYE
jgi:hypothetical protein